MENDSEQYYRIVLLSDDSYIIQRRYLVSCGFLWMKKRVTWKAVNKFGSALSFIPPMHYTYEHEARLAIRRFLRGTVVLPNRDENGKPMPPPDKCLREGDEGIESIKT